MIDVKRYEDAYRAFKYGLPGSDAVAVAMEAIKLCLDGDKKHNRQLKLIAEHMEILTVCKWCRIHGVTCKDENTCKKDLYVWMKGLEVE